ncbi:hypothetical protein ACH4UM_33150 [Streptomyces sp. NPDC020801]|uniref:hypothetical protein n=1 Tax=unclassified Streptomyces TaxID=2593676 RepID=UPI0037A85D92
MTELIRTALEWVGVVLLGRRTPGRRARTDAGPQVSQTARVAPSPHVWGARLVVARSLRPRPPAQPSGPCGVHDPAEHRGALVRPYVAQLDVMLRTARTGAHVDPWEAVQ